MSTLETIKNLDSEVNQIFEQINFVKQISNNLLKILPSFNIADRSILSYGLKPHIRSVAWLVEQVIVQQTKYNKKLLGIDEVNFDLPDTCLHDFEIYANNQIYYVNVKTHQSTGKKNKNDISAVEKLYSQYCVKPDYNLLYLCMGIKFDDITISFEQDQTIVFSAQFLPIYVNPRNDKIQAYYQHENQIRTRQEFLNEIISRSKSIKL